MTDEELAHLIEHALYDSLPLDLGRHVHAERLKSGNIKATVIVGPEVAEDARATTWRRVEDELPEVGTAVLTYSSSRSIGTAYWVWRTRYDNHAAVTHWMPLPEPPDA